MAFLIILCYADVYKRQLDTCARNNGEITLEEIDKVFERIEKRMTLQMLFVAMLDKITDS